MAAKTLNLHNKEDMQRVLVFEDGWPGVQAARAADMEVIWVPDEGLRDFRESATTADVTPTQTLSSLQHFVPEDWGLPPYRR